MTHRAGPFVVDPAGRFARCPRCGWLDRATLDRCAQCSAAFGRPSPPPILDERALSPRVELAPFALRDATVDDLVARRSALDATPEPHGALRRALVSAAGRHVTLCDEPTFAAHAARVASELDALRGVPRVLALGTEALLHALADAGVTLCDPDEGADLVVCDRALDCAPALRRALGHAPYAALWEPAPLRDGLASVHALYSLLRPSLVGTRRSFARRFRRGAAPSALETSALGALLAPVTIVLPGSDALPLRAWIAAAPSLAGVAS